MFSVGKLQLHSPCPPQLFFNHDTAGMSERLNNNTI